MLLAPLSVPAYILFLAASNLLGGAFYIVIEATLSRILGRPISLSRAQMAMLALPVLAAAPFAAAAHLLMAAGTGLFRLLCWIGHWQAGVLRTAPAFALGLCWSLVAAWCTITCLNAAAGLRWIGLGIEQSDVDVFVDFRQRGLPLRDLPPHMQQNRRALIRELDEHQAAVTPRWRMLREQLASDSEFFDALPVMTCRRLTNLPWFYFPGAFSEDGLDHSVLLLGPLLFVIFVMVRWPGTFAVLRVRALWVAGCLLRVAVAATAIFALVRWQPLTAYSSFLFPEDEPPGWFVRLSPAAWIGMDFQRFCRPEWWLFNAALWMSLVGAVAFIWWTAWRVSPFLGWPRYYVAFLASRLLQRKRIAFFSVGAVTLCVAMMIIVISVMGGFVDSIRERANGLLGDLVVDGSLQGFPFYREFIAEIAKMKDEKTGRPLVRQATPVIHSYGVLQLPDAETHAVAIRGIRLDEYVQVNRFGEDLFYRNRYGPYSLGRERGQPVYRPDADGMPDLPGSLPDYVWNYLLATVLPPLPAPWPVAMDEHYRAYLASLPAAERTEEEKRYRRFAGDFYPGPGVLRPCYGADCHAEFVGKPYPGIIIGRDVLFRRKASGEYDRDPQLYWGTACRLTVLPISRDGSVSQESPPAPWLRYIDDSKTGIHEIDSRTVYVDFDVLQSLMSMGPQERIDGGFTSPRCSQVMIKLHDEFSWPRSVLVEKKEAIKDVWRAMERSGLVSPDPWESRMMNHLRINTWEEMQASYIAAIEKEKFLVLIMFGVISIVAVFLILCIFYMIVQEKTRDVGIIKSVGASTEGVVAVFLVYGAAIGLVGCVLGSLLGTSFVTHINEIQDILARINPAWRVWSPETYSFDKIPSQWKMSEVLWICGLSIVSAVAGAAIPAMRAGRTWPVEALRYE